MGEFLSVADVVRSIDQAGNKDGTAALEDIRPHLDTDQKIFLNASGDAKAGDAKFRQALWTLNRICGRDAEVFHLPSLLGCPVFQNGKIEAASLKVGGISYVLSLFEKAFRNNNTDALTAERYKEFLDFIKKNGVPLHELYNVLEKGAFSAADQKTCLFQLCLYAAMWHLKHNVKAFAPEALAKYPEWFRKKVEGFEDNVLGRLKNWEITSKLGSKDTVIFLFDARQKVVMTPPSSPFPSLLNPFFQIHWHELFHAYRASQVVAEPRWLAERDASLVAAIVAFRLNGILNEEDKKFRKIISEYVDQADQLVTWHLSDTGRGDLHKEILRDMQIVHRYALAFLKQDKEEINRLALSFEDVLVKGAAEFVIAPYLSNLFQRNPEPTSNTEAVRKEYKAAKKQVEELKRQLESRVYHWRSTGGKETSIGHMELMRKLNALCENHAENMTEEILQTTFRYGGAAEENVVILMSLDIIQFRINLLNKGLEPRHWPAFKWEDMVATRRFLNEHKSLFIAPYRNFSGMGFIKPPPHLKR